MDVGPPFPADPQTPEAVQPRKRGQLTGPNPTDRGKGDRKSTSSWTVKACPCRSASPPPPPRQPGSDPARPRYSAHPLPSRPAASTARQAARRQGYDYRYLRQWLASRGIRHRLARKGVESSQCLGRHRWVVERTVSWLSGCRAQAGTLPRLHRHRRDPHMPPQAQQVKWRLSDSKLFTAIHFIRVSSVYHRGNRLPYVMERNRRATISGEGYTSAG